MSVKLANKFLEKNKINKRILQKIDELEEYDEQFELVPKIKNRRISSIFRIEERKVSQLTLDSIATMVVFFAAFVYGLSTAKSQIIYTTKSKLFWSASQPIGSLLCAVLLNLLGRPKCCALFLLVVANAELFSSELSNDSWLSLAIVGVKGFTSGALMTAMLVSLIDIWRHKSPPLLQTFFFFISLSTLIVTSIPTSNPKHQLNVNGCQNLLKNTSEIETCVKLHDKNGTSSPNEHATAVNSYQEWIKLVSICQIFLSICGIALFTIIADNYKHYSKQSDQLVFKFRMTKTIFKRMLDFTSSEDTTNTWKEYCFTAISTMLILCSLISIKFANVKLLASISGQGYAQSLIFIMNVCQTFFAGLMIITARLVPPKVILIISVLVIEFSILLLIIFGRNSYAFGLVVSVVMAIGFSTTTASVYALMERSLIVNHNICAVVVSAGALMSTITDIIEDSINAKNRLFYVCMSFIAMALSLIVLSLISFSKFFINSCDDFNVRPISAKFGSNQYTFERNDNYGSYKLRETSIVSI